MIKQLFTTRKYDNPDDPWWDGVLPWYNRCYEHSGTRVRFMAGDLLAEAEHEGGGVMGPQFSVELNICQEDIPEFYLPEHSDAKFDIHYFSIVVWRWGIYLSIRGRIEAST